MQVYTLPETMYVEEKQSRNTMQLVQDCFILQQIMKGNFKGKSNVNAFKICEFAESMALRTAYAS